MPCSNRLNIWPTGCPYESLPADWNTFDLARFSPGKALWDYQQKALQRALAVLWKYYEEFDDFIPGQDAGADKVRREKLTQWYEDVMLLSGRERRSLDLSLARTKLSLRSLVADYFPLDEAEPVLDFRTICNRMGFWMATGSGKTIVLVKLLEVLHLLMRRGGNPRLRRLDAHAPRGPDRAVSADRLGVQSRADAPMHIELRELREYSEAKREAPGGLFGGDSTLRVFYYRSDNLSDEHKERIVDFRNYDNHGRWYVLLDEAHKGGARTPNASTSSPSSRVPGSSSIFRPPSPTRSTWPPRSTISTWRSLSAAGTASTSRS